MVSQTGTAPIRPICAVATCCTALPDDFPAALVLNLIGLLDWRKILPFCGVRPQSLREGKLCSVRFAKIVSMVGGGEELGDH